MNNHYSIKNKFSLCRPRIKHFRDRLRPESSSFRYLNSMLLSFLLITTTQAADIENGQSLHNENCVRCHQPTLYQKEDREIKTLQQLHERVLQCELANDLAWFEEEVDDVSEYLNVNYYLFGIK